MCRFHRSTLFHYYRRYIRIYHPYRQVYFLIQYQVLLRRFLRLTIRSLLYYFLSLLRVAIRLPNRGRTLVGAIPIFLRGYPPRRPMFPSHRFFLFSNRVQGRMVSLTVVYRFRGQFILRFRCFLLFSFLRPNVYFRRLA